MSHSDRLRRSMLYMPGSNARALGKARSLDADALILDLEDAVAPEAKTTARDQVCAELRTGGFGHREVLVRINATTGPWGRDDIAAVAGLRPDAIVLPKVECAEAVRDAVALMDAAGAGKETALWCMIETPRGVLGAADIADASPRLAGFLMGTADLAKDLDCAHPADRAPMLYALQATVLAARAAGIAVLDGVHVALDDEAGFEASCRQGRDMGFDGRTLIHPRQIEAANRIYGPDEDEVARARRIVAAHAEAVREGRGVTVVDGRLVEALHVRQAERVIAKADAIAARLKGS